MKKVKYKKGLISTRRLVFINLLVRKEKNFFLLVSVSFLLAGIFYPYPAIAMWIGFALAAYSAVANDSIQTIGTFIASGYDKKWWMLWLYIGVIFLATVSVSWWVYDGDVSFQRLASAGFSEAPASFHFLQIAAPVFLLIITRLRMPVSTTFLLLSSFSATSAAIGGVLQKSLIGYVVAFVVAFTVWVLMEKAMRKWIKGKTKKRWVVFQWLTSGFLWALWIIQDAANLAVYLPRKLDLSSFVAFSLTIFLGLGIIFYLKGDKIQQVVNEKSGVKDVRAATVIDLVYGLILIIFTWLSTIPMSTTWVFIGLLGGRELAIKLRRKERLTPTWKLISKDVSYALTGLIISVIVAVAANEKLRMDLLVWIGL